MRLKKKWWSFLAAAGCCLVLGSGPARADLELVTSLDTVSLTDSSYGYDT